MTACPMVSRMVFKWNSFDELIDFLELENEIGSECGILIVKKEKIEIRVLVFYWFVLSFVKEKP
jgi:hypothetical protein